MNPPASIPSCTKFSYIYNNVALTNVDKKRFYTIFCPIDDTFDLSSSFADIQITNPSYSSLFV